MTTDMTRRYETAALDCDIRAAHLRRQADVAEAAESIGELATALDGIDARRLAQSSLGRWTCSVSVAGMAFEIGYGSSIGDAIADGMRRLAGRHDQDAEMHRRTARRAMGEAGA